MGLLTVTQERQPRLVDETEWRQFRNWASAWLLLPNVPFMAVWFIGCPPRAGQILFMAVAGLLIRGAALPLRIALFLFMFSYALATFVCNLFDLSTRNLLDSLLMLDALSPAASLEYQMIGLGALAVAVVGIRLLRRHAAFKSPLLMIAALASASLLAIIDTAATWSNRGNYLKAAPSDGYFGSGVTHFGAALWSGTAAKHHGRGSGGSRPAARPEHRRTPHGAVEGSTHCQAIRSQPWHEPLLRKHHGGGDTGALRAMGQLRPAPAQARPDVPSA